MRILFAVSVMLLTGLLAPSSAHAQTLPDSLVGRRLRIRLAEQPREVEGVAPPQEMRGTLLRVTADSLTLQLHPGAGPLTVASAAVERLDVSGGVRSRGESAVREGSRMAVFSAVEFAFLNSLSTGRPFHNGWAAAAGGVAFGTLFGGVFGAFRPQERWKRFDWP